MADDRPYNPDPTNEITLEWIVRELWRISDALSNEQRIEVTDISNTDSPYTVQDRDKVIFADTASAAITINLPVGRDERIIYIKNTAASGANKVTVAPNGSDDIDNLGQNVALDVNDSIRIQYSEDDSNWYIL